MTRSIDTMMDFFLREKGEPIYINGIQQLALVRDVDDKLKETDEKIIRVASPLNTGDIVDYRNERYMVTSQIDSNEQSYRGRMRKCNYSMAFNFNGNVKWFDGIVEGKVFSIDAGNVISIPDGTIIVTLQDNADTRNIALSQRFYNTRQPFKVDGIDRTMKGITKLSCSMDLIMAPYDDVENNIVDRWKYEIAHTYALTIENGTTANVLINDILQLNVTTADNGSPIANPAITFTSSDPNIVSVDNEGRIMGIEVGEAMITAKLTFHPTVQDTIQITTVETLTHQYSITITGSSTVKLSQSQSYTATIYDNGKEVFDQSVQWGLRNEDNLTPIMGSITTSTGNSATVKAGSNTGYINKYLVLSAALSSDPIITIEKTIQIKSLL